MFTEEEKTGLLTLGGLAYSAVGSDPAENWALWEKFRTDLLQTLRTKYAESGWWAPALFEEHFWKRVDRWVPDPDRMGHMRFVEALLTDATTLFFSHCWQRFQTGGNVHIEITGWTGMAKSSYAIWLMGQMKRLFQHCQDQNPIGYTPEALEKHLVISIQRVPEAATNGEPGDTILVDEFYEGAGQGEVTARKEFRNFEDSIRAAQQNMVVCSPRKHELGTMQATFEAVLWNPDQQQTLFLVYVDGTPIGHIPGPWAPKHLWDVYGPWKTRNVERTRRGAFPDSAYIVDVAYGLFQRKEAVDYLCTGRKPTLQKFQRVLKRFGKERMLSGAMLEEAAGWVHDWCYEWKEMEPHFEEWFGRKPIDGIRRVAMKCHEG